jgi:hypothetical protein
MQCANSNELFFFRFGVEIRSILGVGVDLHLPVSIKEATCRAWEAPSHHYRSINEMMQRGLRLGSDSKDGEQR